MLVKEAPVIWNMLNGLVCVYKQAEVSCGNLRKALITKICSELNQMECRPPMPHVVIEGNIAEKLHVQIIPSFADHPSVVGPRYQPEDLPVSWSNFLGRNTSGVLLLGLRSGTLKSKYLRENRPTRAYKIKGVFGKATDNGFISGKVVEKSTWRHVKKSHIESLLSNMQASHQKKMFDICGVDLQSQTAYELAVQGPIRPENSKMCIIYGIKCVEFDPPNFTIEIQSINENESYLLSLVNEIGLKLHSTAHCVAIQCIRHSCFTLDDALLQKHWDIQNILDNLQNCNQKLETHSHLLYQNSATLRSMA